MNVRHVRTFAPTRGRRCGRAARAARPAYERLVFHLAVDIEQRLAKLSQRLNRHCLTIDVGARAAIRCYDATQRAFAVVPRLLAEPGEGRAFPVT